MLTAFPPGSRVVVTGKCCAPTKLAGHHGRVRGLSNFGAEARDYQVEVEGSDSPYELLCPNGMRRLDS